ncbi:MAG: ABC transporter ATP-binding protein [Planctomycetales bacterium]|nr:ABC transporter ATP-binding protein [Planctomycetales bacterium]
MTKRPEEAAAAIAPILEEFAARNLEQERNVAKRVFSEVRRTWPGDPQALWWRWIAEAATSLGARAKSLDCTVSQAISMVRDGAKLVWLHDRGEAGGLQWLLASPEGRRIGLFASSADRSKPDAEGSFQHQSVSVDELRERMESAGAEPLRCVVLLECGAQLDASGPVGPPMPPLRRLWRILRPEASDIWIVAVFAFVVSLLTLATPIAVEALVNTVAFGRFLQPIVVLAGILLTFLGFQGAIRALQTYVVEIIQRRLFARVAGDLAFRLPRVDVESIDDQHLPELVNRFFDVVTVQKVAAQLLSDGLDVVLSTLIGMAVLGFYHPWLLGFDLFLLFAIGLGTLGLGRGAVGSAIKESKHKYYMANWLEEVARCQHAFHGVGGPEFALERADRLIHEYLVARRKHFRIVMRQVLFALGLQAIASTVLLGLGGWLVVSGELTLGQLVAAELIVTVIVRAFAKFGKHMESFYDLLASTDKLGALFDLQTERSDGMLSADNAGSSVLAIRSLQYGWPDQAALIDDLTVELKAGEHAAVLGGSGTGKSTLLELIYGIRRPKEGLLMVDGFQPGDLRPDVLRSHVALARSGEIFQGTIEENVHLHREDVTSGDIRSALEGVGLLERVLEFRDGCDTKLTNAGRPLSDTQCGLLAVARAAVGRPALLLIDGVLDGLGDAQLDHVCKYLLDPDQPWTVLLATARSDVAARLTRQICLNPVPAGA